MVNIGTKEDIVGNLQHLLIRIKYMNNLVAKHCRKYNKATVQKDRTKYNKKLKHKHRYD